MNNQERNVELYVLAKSFPPPDKHYGDRDCIGGVIANDDGYEWVRIYPVIRQKLISSTGLHTIPSFSLISCTIAKDTKDKREESYRISESSVVIKKKLSMKERIPIFSKIIAPHHEYLDQLKKLNQYRTSLGMIEIEIESYRFRKIENIDEKIVDSIQLEMFKKGRSKFDKPGHNLTVKFKCKNNPNCKGHGRAYKAEEFETAYNKFKSEHPESYLKILGDLFEKRYMNPDNHVYAIEGTMKSKHLRWMLGGLTHLKKMDIMKFKKQSQVLNLPLEFAE